MGLIDYMELRSLKNDNHKKRMNQAEVNQKY